MRSARVLLAILVVGGGLAIAVPRVTRAIHQLRTLTAPTVAASPAGAPAVAGSARPRWHGLSAAPALARPVRPAANRGGSVRLLKTVAFLFLAGVGMLCALALLLSARRNVRRRTRAYALYELHLSTHDQAKGQDLEDMVEQVANIVRAWPADRARNGQPYVALELICSSVEAPTGEWEMEWSINIRCQPKDVVALDGAISATYPDVRLGRVHGEQPHPRPGRLREPGYLMRLCKERSFVYPLIAAGEQQGSSPLEQIARAQIAQGAPSVVRFQLVPTPSSFEKLARRLYRRHESKLVREERWGKPDGGLWSTFNRAEMRAAERTQNRSLFWLETVVAAASPDVCKAVSAAVQSRRGENRLRRRWMVVRQGLYRRRFPRALGPLIPSFRCLASAAEVAHLLELPSARMKGVPVRRVTIPRIPASPEMTRGSRPRSEGPTSTVPVGAGST